MQIRKKRTRITSKIEGGLSHSTQYTPISTQN
uniref:Uncharacterized protein n=1 Tax=Cucumis melo TaxID=3656 RepID=A0A9I9ECU7_CUCME